LAYDKWDLPNTRKGKLRIKYLDYSASREYLVHTDVVEHDGHSMSQPGFDLILGTSTLNELGSVLNFQAKEIDIDDIIFPMRDIIKLSTRAKIERVWIANNNVMIHEPKSTLEATQRVVKILDAKYEKKISMQQWRKAAATWVFLIKRSC
jgi:hypothetical protein